MGGGGGGGWGGEGSLWSNHEIYLCFSPRTFCLPIFAQNGNHVMITAFNLLILNESSILRIESNAISYVLREQTRDLFLVTDISILAKSPYHIQILAVRTWT